MERGNKRKPLSAQIRAHSKKVPEKKKYDGNTEVMISTGSTLLDLAICGTRKRGGGLPSQIMIEIFGPESSGKTVLLCEIGGAVQRHGGDLLFNDTEARLNEQFASMFDLDTKNISLVNNDTVKESFIQMNKWIPKKEGKVNGILIDSLAALSTDLEMDDDDGDKMGMKRAKDLSEGWRKFARKIKQNNYIVACSNQIRVKTGAKSFGEQFTVPGGKATGFYASVRLKMNKPKKIKKEISYKGKKVEKTIGVEVEIEVYKNSTDKPYRTADVIIDFDYGIDNIRANLQYLKKYSNQKVYFLNDSKLDVSLAKSITIIEEAGIEEELNKAVIDLWYDIDSKFQRNRKKKRR